MTNTSGVGSQLRLDLLREALPYIQRFKGKTFVVKFSGKVTEDHDRLISLCEELALIHQVGIRVCVIHGGGKQLSDLAKKLGVEQTIIEGRRVTDDDTLEMAKMIFAGKINTDILAALLGPGGQVRVYEALNGPGQAARVLARRGFHVSLAMYMSTDDAANRAQIDAAMAIVDEFPDKIVRLIVGNETQAPAVPPLVPLQQLIDLIRQVRGATCAYFGGMYGCCPMLDATTRTASGSRPTRRKNRPSSQSAHLYP